MPEIIRFRWFMPVAALVAVTMSINVIQLAMGDSWLCGQASYKGAGVITGMSLGLGYSGELPAVGHNDLLRHLISPIGILGAFAYATAMVRRQVAGVSKDASGEKVKMTLKWLVVILVLVAAIMVLWGGISACVSNPSMWVLNPVSTYEGSKLDASTHLGQLIDNMKKYNEEIAYRINTGVVGNVSIPVGPYDTYLHLVHLYSMMGVDVTDRQKVTLGQAGIDDRMHVVHDNIEEYDDKPLTRGLLALLLILVPEAKLALIHEVLVGATISVSPLLAISKLTPAVKKALAALLVSSIIVLLIPIIIAAIILTGSMFLSDIVNSIDMDHHCSGPQDPVLECRDADDTYSYFDRETWHQVIILIYAFGWLLVSGYMQIQMFGRSMSLAKRAVRLIQHGIRDGAWRHTSRFDLVFEKLLAIATYLHKRTSHDDQD